MQTEKTCVVCGRSCSTNHKCPPRVIRGYEVAQRVALNKETFLDYETPNEQTITRLNRGLRMMEEM